MRRPAALSSLLLFFWFVGSVRGAEAIPITTGMGSATIFSFENPGTETIRFQVKFKIADETFLSPAIKLRAKKSMDISTAALLGEKFQESMLVRGEAKILRHGSKKDLRVTVKSYLANSGTVTAAYSGPSTPIEEEEPISIMSDPGDPGDGDLYVQWLCYDTSSDGYVDPYGHSEVLLIQGDMVNGELGGSVLDSSVQFPAAGYFGAGPLSIAYPRVVWSFAGCFSGYPNQQGCYEYTCKYDGYDSEGALIDTMFVKYVECPEGVDYPPDHPEWYFRNKQHMYDYMCGEARKHFEARAAQVVPAAKDAIAAEFRGMAVDRLTDVIPFSAGLKAVYRSLKVAPVVVKVILRHSSTVYDAYDNVDGAQDILQNMATASQSRLQFEKMYALGCNLINAENSARETATQQFPNDGTPINRCPIDEYMDAVGISHVFARANCECSHSSSQ